MKQVRTFGQRNAGFSGPAVSRPLQSPSSASNQTATGSAYDRVMASAGSRHARNSQSVSVTETDMMRAIGSNWPKYRDLWIEMNGSNILKPSFSFAAFFLSSFWALYRKQYAIFFGIMLASMIIIYVAPQALNYFSFAVMAMLGIFGKSIVVRSATTLVERVHSLNLPAHEEVTKLERAGGTNIVAPISIAVILFLLGFIAGAAQGVRQKNSAKPPLRTGAAIMLLHAENVTQPRVRQNKWL